MPEDIATAPAKSAPPAEVNPDPPMQGADIADVYKDFDAADAESSAPPPKKESGQVPPPRSKPAASAEAESERDSDEDTSRKAKDTSASNAGSDAAKDKTSKEVSDEDYARMSKTDRVAFNKSLREENRRLNQALSSLKQEHEKVRTAKPDEGRLKETQELLDATRAELKQAQEHLRLTAYERSDEFNEKYKKPYISAYTMGRNKTASLKVTARTNDEGEVVQAARQGTQEDFDQIMRIADDDAAAEYADRLFGSKAATVLYYRERVNELHQQSQQAIEDRRGAADKLAKEQSEAQKRQAEESETKQKERWTSLRREIETGEKAHPEWFQAAEGDEDAPKIITAGKAVADSLFTGVNPKTGKPYTPDGLVRFHAFTRNALAAHGPLVHQVSSLKAKVASLEAELSEFKESSTLEDAGRRGEERGEDGTIKLPGREEFEEADRRSR